MRAITLQGSQFRLADLPDPSPTTGQLLVRPLFTGICGSDLSLRKQMAALEAATPEEARDQLPVIIPGHEFSAEIVGIGPDTDTSLKVGNRVTGLPFTHSHDGPACIGLSPLHSGGLASLSCVDAVRSFRVPDTVPDDLAALTEPLSVGLHATNLASRNSGPNMVIGCGPVGLAVILSLKLAGRGPILAADFSAERRAVAASLGADIVLDPKVEAPYARWTKEATPEGYDADNIMTLLGMGPKIRPGVIFECVGVPGVIQQIFEGAPRGARVVVVGVCMEQDRFEPFFGINKELNVQFVLGYTPEEFALTLGHLAEGKIDGSPLVTGKVGVEGVKEAFAELGNPEKHAKILVEPWR